MLTKGNENLNEASCNAYKFPTVTSIPSFDSGDGLWKYVRSI